MEFSVGQHIVHPAHGAGTIVGVQEQELVEGYQRYYVIRFADKRLTVRVPLRRTSELGLRTVMGTAKCQEVFGVLSSLPKQLPSNFKDRRRVVEKLIHSGKPLQVAEALRELSWRRELKPLNKADSELLTQANGMLVEEMSLATGEDKGDVEKRISEALGEAVRSKHLAVEQQAAE
jgi:CarD family transcriptional regulator